MTILAILLALFLNAARSEEQAMRQRAIDMQAEVDRACGVL